MRYLLFFVPVLLYIVSLLLLLFSIVVVVLLLVPRVYKHWPHKFCCERRERTVSTLMSRDVVLIIITIIFLYQYY